MTEKRKMDMHELMKAVEFWAIGNGLYSADPYKQMLKVNEKVGKLNAAMARSDEAAVIDAIGDSLVTLIVLCSQLDLSPAYCLQVTYETIRHRKGKMVNGVFFKSEDLK